MLCDTYLLPYCYIQVKKKSLRQGNLPEQLVFTVPEAAEKLRIGIGRCYELARCGQLRSIKIGKRILIPRASIFEFLGMTEVTPV